LPSNDLPEKGEKTGGRQRSDYEDSNAAQMIGFSKAKREVAIKLGVGPYSANKVFQKELNRLAWPTYAGGLVVQAGMTVVTGGAGLALSAANWTNTLTDALRDKSPGDLRLMNLGLLLQMGVPRADADAFLNNPAFSPTNQTILVASFGQLTGAHGQVEFIRMTGRSEDETDAMFCQQSAQLMVKVNATTPIVQIMQLNGLPVCRPADGTVIVPIQWDYVAWTPMAERFVTALQAEKFGTPAPGYAAVITGVVSPMARAALTARGFQIFEKQLNNPLQ